MTHREGNCAHEPCLLLSPLPSISNTSIQIGIIRKETKDISKIGGVESRAHQPLGNRAFILFQKYRKQSSQKEKIIPEMSKEQCIVETHSPLCQRGLFHAACTHSPFLHCSTFSALEHNYKSTSKKVLQIQQDFKKKPPSLQQLRKKIARIHPSIHPSISPCVCARSVSNPPVHHFFPLFLLSLVRNMQLHPRAEFIYLIFNVDLISLHPYRAVRTAEFIPNAGLQFFGLLPQRGFMVHQLFKKRTCISIISSPPYALVIQSCAREKENNNKISVILQDPSSSSNTYTCD